MSASRSAIEDSTGSGRPLSHQPDDSSSSSPKIGNRLDVDIDEKAIGERGQLRVRGQVIGGPDAHPQRTVDAGMAAAKSPLVENA